MKLFINREVIEGPFGGGNNFVRAIFEHAPKLGIYVGSRLNQKYDVAFLMDPRPDETTGIGIDEVRRFKLFQPSVKIVQRVNECDARKQTTGVDQMLLQAAASNDATIFVSAWMQDYFKRRNWPCAKQSVIYNGVDSKIFKPRPASISTADKAIKRIVTHHWSDNAYKGSDVHKWLDDFVSKNADFEYTYVGRTQDTLPNTKMVDPLFGAALGDELRRHNVYVTGTVCDPGPNHCIEAIASGLPTFAHVRGGGAVEFVDSNHTYDTVEQLEQILRKTDYEPNSVKFGSWEECVLQYLNVIKGVISG